MLSYLFVTLLFLILSAVTAGIASIVYCVLLDFAVLGQYAYALTFIVLAVISIVYLIINMTMYWENIINKIGILIMIGLTIFAICTPIHSMSFNLIYQNIILRILIVNLAPSLILNFINLFMANDDESFMFRIGMPLIMIVASLYISFCVASTAVFVADVWFPDISKSIQSCFKYDNQKYDEIRKKEGIDDEYNFLKERYEKAYNEYEITCSINEKECLDEISKSILKNAKISDYGYSTAKVSYTTPEIRYLSILDRKTNYYSYYKINYKDFSFEESSYKEFDEQTTKY